MKKRREGRRGEERTRLLWGKLSPGVIGDSIDPRDASGGGDDQSMLGWPSDNGTLHTRSPLGHSRTT